MAKARKRLSDHRPDTPQRQTFAAGLFGDSLYGGPLQCGVLIRDPVAAATVGGRPSKMNEAADEMRAAMERGKITLETLADANIKELQRRHDFDYGKDVLNAARLHCSRRRLIVLLADWSLKTSFR